MNLEIVKFHPKHLELATLRDEEKRIFSETPYVYEKIEALADSSKQAVTMMLDGRIVAYTGFVEGWPGMCKVWMVPTTHLPRTPFFARHIRRYVDMIAKTFKYHRIETECPDDALHNRWMEYLGFHSEGVKEKFTSDQRDYRMHARIFIWA